MKSTSMLIAILFFATGCTTVTFVRKDLTPQKQAVVRHQPTTNPDKEAKYKAEVAKEAKNFCGGDYKVTKEYQARENTGTSTGIGTGFGVGFGGILLGTSSDNTAMYNFVEFSCVQ